MGGRIVAQLTCKQVGSHLIFPKFCTQGLLVCGESRGGGFRRLIVAKFNMNVELLAAFMEEIEEEEGDAKGSEREMSDGEGFM